MNAKFFASITLFTLNSMIFGMQSDFDCNVNLELLNKIALISLNSLPSNIYNPGNITATEECCGAFLTVLCDARESKFAGYDMEKILVMKNRWKTTYFDFDGTLEDMIKLHKTMLKTCGKQKIIIPSDGFLTRDQDKIDTQTTLLFSSLQSLRKIKCNVSAIHINLLASQANK